jgi:chromosome segregation ATPase
MSFQSLGGNGQSKLAKQINTYQNRMKLVNDNKDKIDDPDTRRNVKKYIVDLEKLGAQISNLLETEPDAAEHRVRYNQLSSEFNDVCVPLKEQINKIDASVAPAGGEDGEQGQQMNQIDAEAEEIELLNRQAEDIAADMAALKDTTLQVHEQIEQDHEKLQHIDETIVEAKENMVEGNKELEIAEKHQKKTCLLL